MTVHHRHPIGDADYRYVLAALVFVPSRWIDRFGPRRLDPREREATFHFYRRLGDAMRIGGVPSTMPAFEAEFDAYELTFDPAAAALYDVTRDLMLQRAPAALRRFAWLRRAVAAAGDTLLEPAVRAALGVPEPPGLLEGGVHAVLRARGRLRRLSRVPDTDRWLPGRPNAAYPRGYALDRLGPERR